MQKSNAHGHYVKWISGKMGFGKLWPLCPFFLGEGGGGELAQALVAGAAALVAWVSSSAAPLVPCFWRRSFSVSSWL